MSNALKALEDMNSTQENVSLWQLRWYSQDMGDNESQDEDSEEEDQVDEDSGKDEESDLEDKN